MNELSPFLKTVDERGFLRDCTDLVGLDKQLKKNSIGYAGFDLTADSLHVGSLALIMLLRWFQKAGHTPIILLGGATTQVGDPSGKTKSRPILSEEEIEKNKTGIRKVFSKFLDENFIMIDNLDWFNDVRLIPFLRDVGQHFSINQMITHDTVKTRLENNESFSFLEFNYSIFQAFDFVQLHRRFKCAIQFGGSDQWGNITSGIDLGRKMDKAELFGLTIPLITTSDGSKMGKTENGAIWLDENKTKPLDFWQFWRNTSDNDVKRFLLIFTDLEVDEINELTKENGQALNLAKKVLATKVTELCHGSLIAEQCLETATNTFELHNLDGLPTIFVTSDQLAEGISIIQLLRQSGFAKSNSDARRLIEGKGVKLDNMVIEDPKMVLPQFKAPIKLSSGKKNHVSIQLFDPMMNK